jgi:hypothetical protein
MRNEAGTAVERDQCKMQNAKCKILPIGLENFFRKNCETGPFCDNKIRVVIHLAVSFIGETEVKQG